MLNSFLDLIDKLEKNGGLDTEEYKELLKSYKYPKERDILAAKACEKRKAIYGDNIFIRGLIEVSNICGNDCLYCGIRRSNKNVTRYKMDKSDILSCCENGYCLGIKTFVLQGGESGCFNDDVLCDIVHSIKDRFPDCAVTLSLGEKSYKSYKNLFDSGAERYLLRHETIDKTHYKKLHPENMSYENRIRSLNDLKEIGYQTGSGFMVGSPFQDLNHIAKDLKFLEDFKPQMVGIGPFIPHKDTIFAKEQPGSTDLTLFLISLLRLILPRALIPATTALASLDKDGYKKGIKAGANVIMINLAPEGFKEKYQIYDDKICVSEKLADSFENVKSIAEAENMKIAFDRGDYKFDV